MKEKIKVPEGMLNAAWEAVAAKMRQHIEESQSGHVAELHIARIAVEAVLLWLSAGHMDFPLPLLKETLNAVPGWKINETVIQNVLHQGLRRMFLAPPEPHPVIQNVKKVLATVVLNPDEAAELMDAVRRCTSPEPNIPGGSYAGHPPNDPEPAPKEEPVDRDGQRSFFTPFGIVEIDDRVPPGEIRLHKWDGPTVMRNIAPAEEATLEPEPRRYTPPKSEPEFMECDSCRAKPGSPALCGGCLHNRAAIGCLRRGQKFVR